MRNFATRMFFNHIMQAVIFIL